MAYAAQAGELTAIVWILFTINILWTIAYDTLYAMVDRDDDLKIGVKSTAILFAEKDRLIIGLLQFVCLLLLVLLGWLETLNWIYFVGLLVVLYLFIKQQRLITDRKREACFEAFKNNNYVGGVIFIALFLSYL